MKNFFFHSFDASKPPPPLPQMNGAIKRPAFDSCKGNESYLFNFKMLSDMN